MIKAVLTIDDISSENTPAIVDYLNEKNIPALMFAWGERVEEYWEQAVYALKHGMIVGNHSYSHPQFSELKPEQTIEEIEKCEDVLNRLYESAGVERKYRPFRFPYGDKGGENQEFVQKYLAENGFNKLKDTEVSYSWWKERGLNKDIDTLWTYDFEEYNIRVGSGFTMEDAMNKVNCVNPYEEAGLLNRDGYQILLLHAHDETEELVPEYYKQFIDHLLANGVEFVKPEFFEA
jgi:peptidoglycan/xylan/chitin deacetylase (PgdA/CDA1 family)